MGTQFRKGSFVKQLLRKLWRLRFPLRHFIQHIAQRIGKQGQLPAQEHKKERNAKKHKRKIQRPVQRHGLSAGQGIKRPARLNHNPHKKYIIPSSPNDTQAACVSGEGTASRRQGHFLRHE